MFPRARLSRRSLLLGLLFAVLLSAGLVFFGDDPFAAAPAGVVSLAASPVVSILRDTQRREISEEFIVNTPAIAKPRIDGYISRIDVGVDGNVIVSGGAASGTATGRENPEAVLDRIVVLTRAQAGRPHGEIARLDTRGWLLWRKWDRGRSVLQADLTGVAGTFAQNWQIPIPFALPSLRHPWESALNTRRFDAIEVVFETADQTRILTGNDRTWNFSGLRYNLSMHRNLSALGPADPRRDTHLLRQFQVDRQVNAADATFKLKLNGGFRYKEVLITVEDAFALVDGINRVQVDGGGIQHYDEFEADIKRLQRDRVPDAAVTDVGEYLIDFAPDGSFERTLDARGFGESGVEITLDVDAPVGTRFVKAYVRAFIPNENLPVVG